MKATILTERAEREKLYLFPDYRLTNRLNSNVFSLPFADYQHISRSVFKRRRH